MAAKKQAAPGKGQKQKNPSIQVRIDRLNDYEGSNIKAFASANIGGAFAIHGIRVVDSQKGMFVAMPQSSHKDGSGNTKYSDIFHTVTAEARNELNEKVMNRRLPNSRMRRQKNLRARNKVWSRLCDFSLKSSEKRWTFEILSVCLW